MTAQYASRSTAIRVPDCTIVCCIEPGLLEAMTLRMIESLRRFGGRAATIPVIAVQPRPGPPLSRAGRQRLDELQADYMLLPTRTRYAWYHFLNKPHALLAAEANTSSDVLTFLDGDTLILGEPEALWLEDGCDFAAKPEMGSIESTGPGAAYEPLWEEFTSVLGLGLDDLPWILAPGADERTRYYVNSGVFSYRRRTALAQHYLRTAESLLAAGVACSRSGVHWIEQAALGLSVVRREMSHRELSGAYNFSLHGWGKRFGGGEAEDIRVLHYHNSMQPDTWPALLDWLEPRFPEAHTWLRECAPVQDPSPPLRRLIGAWVKAWRGAQRRRFLAGCRVV